MGVLCRLKAASDGISVTFIHLHMFLISIKDLLGIFLAHFFVNFFAGQSDGPFHISGVHIRELTADVHHVELIAGVRLAVVILIQLNELPDEGFGGSLVGSPDVGRVDEGTGIETAFLQLRGVLVALQKDISNDIFELLLAQFGVWVGFHPLAVLITDENEGQNATAEVGGGKFGELVKWEIAAKRTITTVFSPPEGRLKYHIETSYHSHFLVIKNELLAGRNPSEADLVCNCDGDAHEDPIAHVDLIAVFYMDADIFSNVILYFVHR